MEHFGARLKRFRDAHGWSQEQVGFELNVSKATVSKWEAGRTQPRLENLAEIRRLIAQDGLTLDYLIDGAAASDGAAPDMHVAEPSTLYQPGIARNADEVALLVRFRALKASRRKGLLTFLASEP